MQTRRNKMLVLLAATVGAIIASTNTLAAPVVLGRSARNQQEEQFFHTPSFNGHDPLAADSPWFREFRRDISRDPVDPRSDAMLRRMREAKGHVLPEWNMAGTPLNYGWGGIPYQVVSGNIAPLSIPGTWSYNPASNGPYLLPPEPIIMENYPDSTYPTARIGDGDNHLLVYIRDETTGGFKELWEYYNPRVTKDSNGQINAVAGGSWRKFDLKNGENPVAGTSSTDAAGMPIAPLLVRYDEVAAGFINHAIRFAANNNDIAPRYKWPARANAYAYNKATGMPYGTRLRVKQSWWDANSNQVLGTNTQARVIGEAIRRYGIVLADGTVGSNVSLGAAADLRWSADLRSRLCGIPITALEVVQTPPMLKVTGPTALKVGETGTWTVTVLPADQLLGSGCGVHVTSENPNSSPEMIHYMWAKIDDSQRSVTGSASFNAPGTYRFKPYLDWETDPQDILVTVSTGNPPGTAKKQRRLPD